MNKHTVRRRIRTIISRSGTLNGNFLIRGLWYRFGPVSSRAVSIEGNAVALHGDVGGELGRDGDHLGYYSSKDVNALSDAIVQHYGLKIMETVHES